MKIVEFLKSMMKPKAKASLAKPRVIVERSVSDGQSLTAYELGITDKGECPDCGDGKLLVGPSGGWSVNAKCDTCGSKFNVCFGMMGERISDPCPGLSI